MKFDTVMHIVPQRLVIFDNLVAGNRYLENRKTA